MCRTVHCGMVQLHWIEMDSSHAHPINEITQATGSIWGLNESVDVSSSTGNAQGFSLEFIYHHVHVCTIECNTCLNPGTSFMMVPSVLTQVIFGSGVPRLWQMISAPVVLEKSTWLGGSWTKTGPDTSLWAETETRDKLTFYNKNYNKLVINHHKNTTK